jgi:hypothetical protein
MSITFHCACGARLRAESRHAGRYSKCPTCMSRLFVPKPEVLAVLNPRLRLGLPATAPGHNLRGHHETPAPTRSGSARGSDRTSGEDDARGRLFGAAARG